MDQDRTSEVDIAGSTTISNRLTFGFLCSGHALVMFSDAIFVVVLTLLVYAQSGSGTELGLVLAAGALPRALLMLPGGVLVDRTVPVSVAQYAVWVRATVLALFAVLVLTGATSTAALVAVAALLGVADAAYFPASSSILPQIVAPAGLARGNAFMQGFDSAGELLGPLLAAVVVTAGGFLVGAGLVTVMALLAGLALLVVGRRMAAGASADPGPSGLEQDADPAASDDGSTLARSAVVGAVREFREGLAHTVARPELRTVLILLCALNLAVPGSVLVGGAVLADQRFGGAAVLGVLLAGAGVGSLVGLVLAGLRSPGHRGVVIVGASVVIGVALAAVGFADTLVLATGALVVLGVGSGYLGVVLVAWAQETTPEHLLGRVMSLVLFATVALDPLSYAFAGALVPAGTTVLFLVCGAVVLVAAASSLAVREVRRWA